MATIQDLQKEIDEIKKRNEKVESDKAWETSLTRRFFLMMFTYLALGVYMKAINIKKPWLNAIIPAIAFYLSTLTLPYFRKLWEKYIHKN